MSNHPIDNLTPLELVALLVGLFLFTVVVLVLAVLFS